MHCLFRVMVWCWHSSLLRILIGLLEHSLVLSPCCYCSATFCWELEAQPCLEQVNNGFTLTWTNLWWVDQNYLSVIWMYFTVHTTQEVQTFCTKTLTWSLTQIKKHVVWAHYLLFIFSLHCTLHVRTYFRICKFSNFLIICIQFLCKISVSILVFRILNIVLYI